MGKKQYTDVGGDRGPESGIVAPEKIVIIEITDAAHPKHKFYTSRLAETNADIIALADAMFEVGWPKGSLAWLYRDGDNANAATARRRITAARMANVRRKAASPKRPPIMVPFMFTTDPATAEAVENAGRVGLPPMQLAREFVALREEHGDANKAAALLVIPLATAHLLERCLSLPPDIRAKVNAHEIPVDVAARMAKGGQMAAREAVEKATDAKTGKVDAGRAKAAARDAVPKRAKALPRPVAEAMAEKVARDKGDPWPASDVAALVRYVLGDREQANGRPWLVTLGTEATKAAKGGAS